MLPDLPPEILQQILEELGPLPFRQNVRLLAVCRSWLDHACGVFYKTISLTQDNLPSFTASNLRGQLSPHGRLRVWQPYVQELNVNLGGFYACRNGASVRSSHNIVDEDCDEEAWIRGVNEDLEQLADFVKMCPNLDTLRFRAWHTPAPDPYRPRPSSFLSVQRVQHLLDPALTLHTLVLDITCPFLDPPNPTSDHLCHRVGSFLSTLHTLRLRLPTLCPEAVTPQPKPSTGLESDSHRWSECLRPKNLNELIINLNLNYGDPYASSHTQACRPEDRDLDVGHPGPLFLNARLAEQVRSLVHGTTSTTQSPSVVRILRHCLVTFDVIACDVLQNQELVIGQEPVDWAADGAAISDDSDTESTEESELALLSDFSDGE